MVSHVSLIREVTVFIFKDPSASDWLLPKWIWIINKSISMNQSQKSYSLKNFLWWTWFWQSAGSKTLHLVYSRRSNWPRREKTLKTHDKKDSLKKMKITGEHFYKEEICKMLEIYRYFQVFYKKRYSDRFYKIHRRTVITLFW